MQYFRYIKNRNGTCNITSRLNKQWCKHVRQQVVPHPV
uniref:Uncharacterized protein n=1 Tax=Anguilla anguilla TaxID=7936 RepID=A0A0E9RLK4_ANGAN